MNEETIINETAVEEIHTPAQTHEVLADHSVPLDNEEYYKEDMSEIPDEEPMQVAIQIVDIVAATKLLETSIERGTFKAVELINVIPVFEKLYTFAQQIEAQEKGAN